MADFIVYHVSYIDLMMKRLLSLQGKARAESNCWTDFLTSLSTDRVASKLWNRGSESLFGAFIYFFVRLFCFVLFVFHDLHVKRQRFCCS